MEPSLDQMDLLVNFEGVDDFSLLLLLSGDLLIDNWAEVGRVELREERVAVERRRDLGQVDPVKQIGPHRRFVDLRPADDPDGLAHVGFVGKQPDGILKKPLHGNAFVT